MTKKYALRKVATGVMSVAIGAQLVAGVVSAQDNTSSGTADTTTSKNETKPSAPKVYNEEKAKKIKAELEAAGISFVEKRTESGNTIYITYEFQSEWDE